MSDLAKSEKSGGGQGLLRAMGLLLLLGLVIYAAPKLNQSISSEKDEPQAAEQQVEDEVTVPQPYAKWIPLIEKQLPRDEESSYEVAYVRLSDDGKKLLIDLRITTGDDESRSDLILERDEFGRYVSDSEVIPMKLYLPDADTAEVEAIAPGQK